MYRGFYGFIVFLRNFKLNGHDCHLKVRPGAWRGRNFAAFAGNHHGKLPARKTRPINGAFRLDNHPCANTGADYRRLDYGKLVLALDLHDKSANRHFCNVYGHKLLEDPPYARKHAHVKCNYWAITFLCLWLIFLQIVLDKGNDADWFGAAWICWMTFFSCVFGILFFITQLKDEEPLVNLKLLLDRNFLFGTAAQIVMMAVFLASAALLPSMLQSLMGYTSFLSGLSMGSRGLGSVVGIVIYGILAKALGDKFFAIAGIALIALGGLYFGTINLQINLQTIAIPNALFGAGMALGMTTLMSLSFSSLKNEDMTNASGLQNLLKNIGGAIGTSLSTTMISRSAQKHQIMMVGNLDELNGIFVDRVDALSQFFAKYTSDAGEAVMMAKANLYNQLILQSNLWGYIDTFRIFAAACLLIIPLIILIKVPKLSK